MMRCNRRAKLQSEPLEARVIHGQRGKAAGFEGTVSVPPTVLDTCYF